MKEKILNSYVFNVMLHGYKNIFCYTGRESQVAFRCFVLINSLLFIVAIILAALLSNVLGFLGEMVCIVVLAGYFLSTLSFNVRRLHDAGYSGLLCLLYLVAILIVWIVSACLPSTPGPNQYGKQANKIIEE
jgi:Predicted membrane protein